MRAQKLSVLALAVVAGLSLAACQGGDSDGASASTGPSAPAGATGSSDASSNSTSSGGGSASGTGDDANGSGDLAQGGGTSGAGTSAAGGSACKTANLSFTSSGGMGEGEVLINMKNTGSTDCTMHGFPGADLKGPDGTVSADRSTLSAPDVTVAPGEETRFTLHYPPNNSGGSGVDFTSLVVTPPNETHAHTMSLGINVPASDSATSGITVDPVGAGK